MVGPFGVGDGAAVGIAVAATVEAGVAVSATGVAEGATVGAAVGAGVSVTVGDGVEVGVGVAGAAQEQSRSADASRAIKDAILDLVRIISIPCLSDDKLELRFLKQKRSRSSFLCFLLHRDKLVFPGSEAKLFRVDERGCPVGRRRGIREVIVVAFAFFQIVA